MTLNLNVPKRRMLQPNITVFGVGGAGCNGVNNMIKANLEGVNFVVANTDAQALEHSKGEHKIQLGELITQGLGAGSYPEVGKASAEESLEEIKAHLEGCNMVFITAGMGGGTGTGAAPVIARLAREQGILTVAVVTKPFHFEGSNRMRVAEFGLDELQRYVDTLIVIPNQNLFRIADRNTTFAEAFKMADDVLHAGVRGITDLMVTPGMINLDFADVRAVMSEMGKAMMGTGEAEGENRAIQAAEAAISNPLLDNASMKGARGVLINITGGEDMTLFEVDEAANRVREEVDQDANIIFGSAFNSGLHGKIRVSVVATGIEAIDKTASHRSQHAVPATSEVRPVMSSTAMPASMSASIPAAPVAPTQAASAPTQDPFAKPKEPRIYGLYGNPPVIGSAYNRENNAERAESESFIPPAPAEPELSAKNAATTPEYRTNGTYNNTHAQLSSSPASQPAGAQPAMSAQAGKQSTAGLLSRMGFGQSKANVPSPRTQDMFESRSNVTTVELEPAHADGQLSEDELDVPAYIRRNNT